MATQLMSDLDSGSNGEDPMSISEKDRDMEELFGSREPESL